MSGCVAFGLSSAGGVVTWFVTEAWWHRRVPAGLRKTAIEIPQAALESRYKVWADGWLPFGLPSQVMGERLGEVCVGCLWR